MCVCNFLSCVFKNSSQMRYWLMSFFFWNDFIYTLWKDFSIWYFSTRYFNACENYESPEIRFSEKKYSINKRIFLKLPQKYIWNIYTIQYFIDYIIPYRKYKYFILQLPETQNQFPRNTLYLWQNKWFFENMLHVFHIL